MNDDTLSRRHFLTAAAAGITLAAGAGARAADEAQPRAAAEPTAAGDGATLRWGIIGTGTRGTFTHIPVLKHAPQSQLVALCDVSEERLKAAISRAGKPVAAYPDYQKLLADREVNAVVIATPNLFHREQFVAALEAGKHVLCEKPAGVTPADADAMKRAADAAKTVAMFGMQYRNTARQQMVRELIASGRIGTPRYIVQNVSRGDWNRSANVWQYADPKLNGGKPANWRFSRAATGGTLNEFDCHYFDLLHWIVGALPERITCDGGIAVYKDGRDTWDHATVTFKYPGDVTAVHTLCLFGPSRNELVVMGDEGSIETKGDILQLNTRATRGPNRTPARSQEFQPKEDDPRGTDTATLRLYEDFLECVKTAGKKPQASAERAVAASKTCWLAELAAERKAEVKWDELG